MQRKMIKEIGQTRREDVPAQLALEELVFKGTSFDELVRQAEGSGRCTREDLLAMGRVVLHDARRFARGEISAVVLPKRLPFAGEYL